MPNYQDRFFFLYDTVLCNMILQGDPDPYNEADSISLPLYASEMRDRAVARMSVPCGGNQGKWLQCGAALFLKS